METWPEIRDRHRREKFELISSLVDMDIKTAARVLGMNEDQLRTYAWHNDISFFSKTIGQTATWARPVRKKPND
jgi:hypothetical protein